MACLRTYATLRIFSDSLHPDKIDRILGIAATSKNPRDQKSRYRHRRETHGWFLTTEESLDSRDNEEHLGAIITLLTPKAEALHRLQTQGCYTDIFCFWDSSGQGGPGLEVEMMERLCFLKLPISWDMYFTDESEDMASAQSLEPEQACGGDGEGIGR